MNLRLLYLFLLLPFSLMALDSYLVEFDVEIPEESLCLIKSTSQLVALQKTPPSTLPGLKHRAEADVENIIKVLHSLAYYNARVHFDYHFDESPPRITVKIIPGPVYPFEEFLIVSKHGEFDRISPKELGIMIGSPAYPKQIIEAEDRLFSILEREGYPLAEILEREVYADQTKQAIIVVLHLDQGPRGYFGDTTIIGNATVREEFFKKKLVWCHGDLYDPCKVQKTYREIEGSGLFSTISISHASKVDATGLLPMTIEVAEAKHRSVAWGLAYATQRGPGLSAEWEHRNIRGLGERLRFDIDLWPDDQEARVLYVKPDFLKRAQDLMWLTAYQHETTKGYTETSISLSGTLERRFSDCLRFSYGIMYKWLRDTRSDVNGVYNLLKAPLQLRWKRTNNLIDPTHGYTVNLKIIPTAELLAPQFGYCINTFTMTGYQPVTEDHRVVLAGKFTIGSIWGSSRRSIPSSERFYEGSESCLRGYRYQTVSPLRHHDKPIGGRSMTLYSLELRVRATESFGWVTFYDFGNVYTQIVPQFSKKILQAVGFGIRYHTPVGPLRLDFAVPLNRRPQLDSRYQIYLSIGQAF